MHSLAIVTATLAASAAAAPALASSPLYRRQSNETANNLDLIHNLELAPTAADRVNMLTAEDFKYDFLAPPSNAVTTGQGGRTVRSDSRVFPALIGTGVSMTVGFIGPCGFNTPHTHPRSSEINIIVEGRLGTEFVAENGVKPISNTLNKYQMTVFPQGALHTEFNPDCEDAASLGSALVKADLGVKTINGQSIEEFRQHLPANVALGVEECLAKCGLKPYSSNKV
ncbi:hypothetical protein KC315_g3281 [Hortaea werneckii]|nr:hypothetical protein KC315_g3281 [Hortaea werneckii]